MLLDALNRIATEKALGRSDNPLGIAAARLAEAPDSDPRTAYAAVMMLLIALIQRASYASPPAVVERHMQPVFEASERLERECRVLRDLPGIRGWADEGIEIARALRKYAEAKVRLSNRYWKGRRVRGGPVPTPESEAGEFVLRVLKRLDPTEALDHATGLVCSVFEGSDLKTVRNRLRARFQEAERRKKRERAAALVMQDPPKDRV